MVTYDVADNKRVQKVFKKMKNWGDHLQYSVFLCHLNDKELAQMKAELHVIIKHDEDQIMIIRLGPETGNARKAIETIGLSYNPTSRSARVF
jgi:CRISPR-associated protein Cas2